LKKTPLLSGVFFNRVDPRQLRIPLLSWIYPIKGKIMATSYTFITIFPELISDFCAQSLLGRAQQDNPVRPSAINISIVNPRDFSSPPHNKVDDIPFGGGAGMVMMAEPLLQAINHARSLNRNAHVVLLSPCGAKLSQKKVIELSSKNLILVCGRYEGIDQRLIDAQVDEEISLGDFILMGGEVAALALLEAVTRLVPGVLGNAESSREESFDDSNLLEAPCYTRPAVITGPDGAALAVPQVLLSGDHKQISNWRLEQRLERTKKNRPDLLSKNRENKE